MVKVAEFDIDMVGQWEDKNKFVEAEEQVIPYEEMPNSNPRQGWLSSLAT